MPKEIILASESQNRQSLLRSAGLPFRAVPSSIDEDAIKAADPTVRVQKIAQAKVHAVADKISGLIIAADTFAVYGGRQYQKPKDLNDARRMLRELSGKDGQSITGICIYDTETREEIVDYRIVRMHCNELTDSDIELYIHNRPVLQWAAVYNPLDELSSRIFVPVGEYVYKVEYYGLPIDVVAQAVQKIGINVDLSKFKA